MRAAFRAPYSQSEFMLNFSCTRDKCLLCEEAGSTFLCPLLPLCLIKLMHCTYSLTLYFKVTHLSKPVPPFLVALGRKPRVCLRCLASYSIFGSHWKYTLKLLAEVPKTSVSGLVLFLPSSRFEAAAVSWKPLVFWEDIAIILDNHREGSVVKSNKFVVFQRSTPDGVR